MDSQWFLCQTVPRRELTARENLERCGYETYLPMTPKDRRRSISDALEPLFPGYLMIKLTMGEDDTRQIKSCRGVSRGLVRFGDQPPVAFPVGCVEMLMESEIPPREYQENDEVYVKSGPFRDLRGTVQRLAGHQRVDVLMEILGDLVAIRMHLRDVEPA